ncbi:translation initiation factor IF-3 [Hugenholtzia roseola]|uniref:translation initiation factor IF-3 n=1 Tax=Hugenholtzia roseola TaxID=1002 RepID=UPI000A3244C3
MARPDRTQQGRGAQNTDEHKINRRIRAKEVRLVGDNIENPGVYSTQKALEMAEAQGLDLVEIAPNGVPPVCKIIDYSKFKYEQKKKQKELKANAHKVIVKEVRFSPNTDEHDFEFKVRHAQKFLEEGNKVKAYVHFVGRAIVFKERGAEILSRFAEILQEYGKIDQPPKMEGKRMIVMFSPIKSASAAPKKGKSDQEIEKENAKNPTASTPVAAPKKAKKRKNEAAAEEEE